MGLVLSSPYFKRPNQHVCVRSGRVRAVTWPILPLYS